MAKQVKTGLLCRRKIIQNDTLSKRQASSAASIEAGPSMIKLFECRAKVLNVSAAALRVAQSGLPRQS